MSSPSIDPIDYPGTEDYLDYIEELERRSYYAREAMMEAAEESKGLRR